MRKSAEHLCRALVGCSLLFASPGCSRTFWRNQADKDSYHALTEQLTDPRWAVPRIDVEPDMRSRFYDPYNPDCAPLPPDDPAAHVSMHWVDGWQGYQGWHKFGDMLTVENPQWLSSFGISVEQIDPMTGEVQTPVPALYDVSLTESVELAQLHNRDYQFQIENVYLAALAVTFQRFQFGVRYLTSTGQEPSVNGLATFVPHGTAGDEGFSVGTAAGISQLLPAGTQWAIEFANNTIWLFGAGNQTSSLSNLSFSIVQPLLFGAGRKVGLELLTQAERTLLYEARDLARFRQELFTDVVGGSSGFLGLLQQVQAIRNTRDNIYRLEEQVERLQADAARNQMFANAPLESFEVAIPPELQGKLRFPPGLQRLFWASPEPITAEEVRLLRELSDDPDYQQAVNEIIQNLRTEVTTLDVLQLQSRLTTQLNALRVQERNLQDTLDDFKILLGLPPSMDLTIDDFLLQPFEIIDPQLQAYERASMDFVDVTMNIDDDDPDLSDLRHAVEEFRKLLQDVSETSLRLVQGDLERVEAALPQRLERLDSETDRAQLRSDIQQARILFEEAAGDAAAIRNIVADFTRELAAGEISLERRQQIYRDLGGLREDLVQLTQNLTVVQVSLRVELIEVQPFDMSLQAAMGLGVENRVDLMNARARVMDARRRVEITANALQGALDVVAEADLNTPPDGNRPFDFRGENSRIRVGLQFTAPLDQIDERNAYRAAQIAYQREKRAYMLFEDEVKLSIREAWRQLYVQRQNLETSRRAVRLAALQFDSAVNESRDPNIRPQTTTTSSSRSGGLQGQNLLNALNSILQAQNDLIGNWITYERNRLNIYRDMGIMEVGEDGVWNDPFYRSQSQNDYNQQPDWPDLETGAVRPADPLPGNSRLGERDAETVVVALDGRFPWAEEAQDDDSRNRPPRPFPGEPLGSGIPGQPEERHSEQPGRRDDHDSLHRAGGDVGDTGRSRL